MPPTAFAGSRKSSLAHRPRSDGNVGTISGADEMGRVHAREAGTREKAGNAIPATSSLTRPRDQADHRGVPHWTGGMILERRSPRQYRAASDVADQTDGSRGRRGLLRWETRRGWSGVDLPARSARG